MSRDEAIKQINAISEERVREIKMVGLRVTERLAWHRYTRDLLLAVVSEREEFPDEAIAQYRKLMLCPKARQEFYSKQVL